MVKYRADRRIRQRNEIDPEWRAQGDRETLIWGACARCILMGCAKWRNPVEFFEPYTSQEEVLRVTHLGAYAKVGVEPGAAMVAPPTKMPPHIEDGAFWPLGWPAASCRCMN